MVITPDQVASWLVGGLGFISAAWQSYNKRQVVLKTEQEKELLSDAKRLQERADILGKLAEDNLNLYTKEHEQHQNTRDFWHKQSNEFQFTLSGCQEKLTELQSKPDYKEIVQLIRDQSQANKDILNGIKEIVIYLKTPQQQKS